MINLDNLKELNSLSREEKEEVLKIITQLSTTGQSEEYNKLILEDYEEIPVDIETFLKDKKYLGNGLINDEGKFTVFPFWVNTLKQIFPDPLKPASYNTLALTGSIGIGKSFMAVLCMLYELYRMLCLKDPYVYYGLQPIDKITFAVMNITLDASKGVAWDKLQQLLQSSDWFLSKGTVRGDINVEWSPSKNIELIAGSLSRHIIGRAVFSAFFDEISFQPNQDVEKQKEKAKALVNTASARMQSRFMKGDKNPTLLILASSKRTEQSYMETFIESKKQNESKTTLVIDEPQWVIREDKNSSSKFKVAIGNKFLSSEVIPLTATENDVQLYRDRGFKVIDVPMGYYENFIDDIDIALTDIAGISTTSSSRYLSGPRIAAIKHKEFRNPFSSDTLEIGNNPEDKNQYYDFFDLESIDKTLLQYPLYIHLDMSISGDKTGLAGVWIRGKKPPVEGQPPSKELYYRTAFVVSIKAPKGYQISFEKNRQFIYWLKENGFNIKGISFDTYQSADMKQQLIGKGYEAETISVDRVKDNICLTGDSLIKTVDGYKKIEDVLPGDKVYSYNLISKEAEIKEVYSWENTKDTDELIVIDTEDGEIKCTPNHLILTQRGYIEAKNLKETDLIVKI